MDEENGPIVGCCILIHLVTVDMEATVEALPEAIGRIPGAVAAEIELEGVMRHKPDALPC